MGNWVFQQYEWSYNHPIGSIYHLYTTKIYIYIYCLLGDYMVPTTFLREPGNSIDITLLLTGDFGPTLQVHFRIGKWFADVSGRDLASCQA